MAIDHITALRILALHEVVKANKGNPSADYVMRKIFMWYSEKFHTPLHQVDDLPVDDVMRAYYEYSYANASDEGMEKELWRLTRTEQELDEEKRKKDEDELYFYEETKATLAEEEAAAVAAEKARLDKLKKIPVQRRVPGALKPQPGTKAGSMPDLPDFEEAPEGIKMVFISEAELDKLAEEDGLGQLPPMDTSLLGLGED
jgi:hypothetical protein